ncbi:unnamed protein product [Ophioblennius macclurei]
MDVLNKLEIFVPVEAEVKNVPLNSLPRSVQRRINLRLPHPEGSSSSSDPLEGTWICPVYLRMRGPRAAPCLASSTTENLSSVMISQVHSLKTPLKMSIVSPNKAAYNVLRGTGPARLTPRPPRSPQTIMASGCREAVVVYRGRIYLSIKRQTRRRTSKPALQSAPTSSSDVSSTSHKKEEPSDHRPEEQHSGPAGGEHAGKQTSTPEEATVSEGKESGGLGPTSSSSSQCDFKSLAQQEKIAQMKARLQRNEAAVNNL